MHPQGGGGGVRCLDIYSDILRRIQERLACYRLQIKRINGLKRIKHLHDRLEVDILNDIEEPNCSSQTSGTHVESNSKI
jgi:hypothetical protein